MSAALPFLFPVNPAGLPNSLCPAYPSGYENLLNLTPDEVAELYWTLEYIDIAYEYTVETVTNTRSFRLDGHNQPRWRAQAAPIFYNSNGYQNPTPQYVYTASFNIGSVARSNPFDGTYAAELSVVESDSLPAIVFGLQPRTGYTLLDTVDFTFYGRTLTAYLYGINSGWTGNIAHTSITPGFYTFL